MKTILTILAFLAVLCGQSLAAESKRPNILFIAIDDQNDWIGNMGGHPLAKTPHIDALDRHEAVYPVDSASKSPLKPKLP